MLFKSRILFSTSELSTFNLAHFKQCQSVFNGKYAHPEPSRGSFQQITLSLIHHLWHLATFCLQLLKQPACFRLHLDREIPFSTLVSHFLSRPRGVKFWVLGSPLQAGVGRTLCRQGGRCPAHGSQHRWCSWCSPLETVVMSWCPQVTCLHNDPILTLALISGRQRPVMTETKTSGMSASLWSTWTLNSVHTIIDQFDLFQIPLL